MEREQINCQDYAALTEMWKEQLERAGWERTWDPNVNGPAYRESCDSNAMPLYEAWASATGTPKDLNRK
jgi:hypothetical protein